MERAFRLRRRYVQIAVKILGIRIEKKGEPTNEPCLYVCNHRSFSDPLIVCSYLDAFVIAKAEVQDIPILHKGAMLTGVIYVQRDDKKSRSSARQVLIDTIKSGDNVLVYPEGTVSAGAVTLPFKTGTFLEAAKHGFPVVPIALEYRDEVDLWEKRSLTKQYFLQFRKARTETKIRFGPVLRGEDGAKLHQDAEKWVNDSLKEMQAGWSRAFG
jgi:1-acyl-sn-glycerol-3-phosphate acyltransferase